eukprot:3877858-Prymnesium_polylepis.1
MEGKYRSTFWRQDTKAQMHARNFDQDRDSVEQQDADRAALVYVYGSYLEASHGDAVRAWLADRSPAWAAAPPAWFTEEWVNALPPSFAAVLHDAMAGLALAQDDNALQAAPSVMVAAIVIMVALSYVDIITDILLTRYLLSVPQDRGYGIVSCVIIALSLLSQMVIIAVFGGFGFYSREAAAAAIGLGPAMQAFR